EVKSILEIANNFFHHKKISDTESAAKFGEYFDQNINHNFQMYIPLQFMEQHYQQRSDIQHFVTKRKKKQQGRLDAADAAITVLLLPAAIIYAATGGL
ncbi:MAG TPA: hypothetical protein VNJ29_01720, partial [Candidatus Nitrosotenuis sp.]|nr:hypothetical protein [Candidatus Nitrosotenuis sp.]